MKILIVNKFLHPNGGSETYIFGLGDALKRKGHEVQYFGMEHKGRCVGNAANSYTQDMDFHGGSALKKLTYPIKTIYSKEARQKIRLVLEDFQPDVVHLNNFNYQLTPAIILEVVKWRKEAKKSCKILFTAHDYQLLCPNHMFNNPATHENCEKCLGGKFSNCIKGKCIHGSTAKSVVGAMEGYFWKWKGVYRYIDTVICCSQFMKTKMDSNPVFAGKTIAKHNFVEAMNEVANEGRKDNTVFTLPYDRYVLYFGRFSKEKGVSTLLKVVKELPEVNFVFAGSGEYGDEIDKLPNATNVGFKTGEELNSLIRGALFSVIPSEWYENCPFSVMESQQLLTPVLGANIGGIPELVVESETGWLFESGNAAELTGRIKDLYKGSEPDLVRQKLKELKRADADAYADWFLKDVMNNDNNR